MRKKGRQNRSGVFLVIAAAIVAFAILGNPVNYLIARFAPPSLDELAATVESTTQVDNVSLKVDETRLMNHVRALAQPRATVEQRAITRQYITEQLLAYGWSPKEQPYSNPDSDGVNIIAEWPSSNQTAGQAATLTESETIVLGAHYDTVPASPGADDNGSAIATLLEAARVIPTLESANLSRTLTLVFFDQEEHQPADGTGLLGSLAYARNLAAPGQIKGAVILDMVGYACRTPGCQSYPPRLPISNVPDTGDFLAVLGRNTDTDLLGAFMLSAQTNWPMVITLPIPTSALRFFPNLLRSDHAPFWERDIPAVFVTDTANFRNPHYHTEQDTPDTLDQSFLRGSAQHIVNAVATLLRVPDD